MVMVLINKEAERMSGINKQSGLLLEKPLHPAVGTSPKLLYFSLLERVKSPLSQPESEHFLAEHLAASRHYSTDVPGDVAEMDAWLAQHNASVGMQYRAYLAQRQAGAPRAYFSTKAHALYFLRAVAPTKMVDGAWLYGFMSHWQDARFSSLINIYLEELGEGTEAMNHVVLYRKLLKAQKCDDWRSLEDPFFIQGALQLALAANTDTHLPEAIGFNLGYEQLPLHLLITAYELKELNIDPYYFTLHTTIDNAQSGHAHKAIEAVKNAMPLFGDTQTFMARVISGVKLNHAGIGTLEIIEQFDIEKEVVRILCSKAVIGQHMHSDRCLLMGKTINDWLRDPGQIPVFLNTLCNKGWIRRHHDPEESQFWKVIAGEKAPMFGVFTAYEKQVIYDWIAGEVIEKLPKIARLGRPVRMGLSAQQTPARHGSVAIACNNVYPFRVGRTGTPVPASNDFNQDQLSFDRYISSLGNEQEIMDFLVDWLSPARHYTAIGLCATRYFNAYFNASCWPPNSVASHPRGLPSLG